jgi:hypothetical protein
MNTKEHAMRTPSNQTRSLRGAGPTAPTRADQIREKAYQLFLARNGAPGDATADWLEAEREIAGGQRPAPSPKPAALPDIPRECALNRGQP